MPKFNFQLQAVLRHRTHIEQQRQRELAVVQKQMTDLQVELKALDEHVKAAGEDVQHHLVGRLDMNFLGAHRRYMVAMQRKAMILVQRMALLQREVDAAQKLLVAAARDRKVMEKLREHRFEQWRGEIARKEMIQLDEVSMQLAFENAQKELARDL